MIGVTSLKIHANCQDVWVNLQGKRFSEKYIATTLYGTIGILKWDFAENSENEYLEGFQPYFSLFH